MTAIRRGRQHRYQLRPAVGRCHQEPGAQYCVAEELRRAPQPVTEIPAALGYLIEDAAFGIALTVVRRRRLDAIGILVLLGIVAGSVLVLASGSAHLVLIDGVEPTVVFGVVCIGSLWSTRPLMFRFAVEAMGADTAKGRAFADKWRYQGFRHAFQVTTVVWAWLSSPTLARRFSSSRHAGSGSPRRPPT